MVATGGRIGFAREAQSADRHSTYLPSELAGRFPPPPGTPRRATLPVLFIGIHNAWDAFVYHVFVNKRDKH